MMQAIKAGFIRPKDKWYVFALTTSTSATFSFDRLRISNSSGLEFAILDPANENQIGAPVEDEFGLYLPGDAGLEQIQPFHTGGGWTLLEDEHDFTFDCSGFSYGNGNSDAATILVKGLKTDNVVWQLYAYPTGYGGTRGANAELISINYKAARIGSVGSEIGRLRLTNQTNLLPYMYMHDGEIAPINAKEVRLEGVGATSIAFALEALVLGGGYDGTLSWNPGEADNSGSDAQLNYDILVNRNWTITGGRPL
jgi:hypothetical protein